MYVELVKKILLTGKALGELDSSLRFTVGIGTYFHRVRVQVSLENGFLAPYSESTRELMNSLEAYVTEAIKAHDSSEKIFGRVIDLEFVAMTPKLPNTI